MNQVDLRENIILAVKNSLNDACENYELKGNRMWTQKILALLADNLRKIPCEKDIMMCPDCGTNSSLCGEWLYDVIWYVNDSEGRIFEVLLALECEWSNYVYDVKYDFEKLLQSKALVKVMIAVEGKSDGLVRDMVQRGILSYKDKQSDERYLLALYKNGQFEYTLFDAKADIM